MLVKGKLLAEETFGSGEQLEARESAEDVVMSNGPLKWVSEEGGTKATLKSTLQKEEGATPVSYTHLTLPTKRIV